jgi:CRISPR-associated protein Csb1
VQLLSWINSQAIRSNLDLEPVDGPQGRVFPPTYGGSENDNGDRRSDRIRTAHVVEKLADGTLRALIDSVASQANRQEAALVAARSRGVIDFADVYIDLTQTEAGLDRLSATEMPHRLSDAILRDSEIDGKAFRKSEFGKRILSTTPNDLTAIIEATPTTALFGCWFSQHDLPRPLKIQRSVVSEIWAENAVLGKAVGSRIDPLQIEKLKLYETADGDWTALEKEALMSANKPKSFKKAFPSAINHGNIVPTIRDQGITAERITLKWAMPMAAIRRLKFGGGKRDEAGQVYIAALGILARVLDHEQGYSLRSRCDLIAKGPAAFEIIDRDGAIESVTITFETALRLVRQAEDAMRTAGLKLHNKVTVRPAKRLVGLIQQNALVQASGGAEEAEVPA